MFSDIIKIGDINMGVISDETERFLKLTDSVIYIDRDEELKENLIRVDDFPDLNDQLERSERSVDEKKRISIELRKICDAAAEQDVAYARFIKC